MEPDSREKFVLRKSSVFSCFAQYFSDRLLEHIDWQRGVEAFVKLRPRWCAVILQENPPNMPTAVTPGRRLLPSIAKAVEIGRPMLVPRQELVLAMTAQGYRCRESAVREVADGK